MQGGDWMSDWLQDLQPNQRAFDAKASQIYMLLALWGICRTNWENKKHRADGERMGSRLEFKPGEQSKRRAGDRGAQEWSKISWLLFRSTAMCFFFFFSLQEELDAHIHTSAPRMLECNGWATFFLYRCVPYFFLLASGRNGHTVTKNSN